jgi:hypothetical protein
MFGQYFRRGAVQRRRYYRDFATQQFAQHLGGFGSIGRQASAVWERDYGGRYGLIRLDWLCKTRFAGQ